MLVCSAVDAQVGDMYFYRELRSIMATSLFAQHPSFPGQVYLQHALQVAGFFPVVNKYNGP